MTIQEFDTALYEKLYMFFASQGFEMYASRKQFRKQIPNGFQNILFSPSEHEGEIWLEVNLGIRINAVEQIVQQFLDNLKGFHEDAMTLVTSVGKLTNNKYFKYKVVAEEDVENICISIQDFMQSQGYQFLDVHSTTEALDSLMNKNPSKPTLYLYNQVHRCFKGLVLAKLNFNPQFSTIAATYHRTLKVLNAKQSHLENFARLESFLEHYSPN